MSHAAPIRLATRQSPLALWQANWVSDRLKEQGHQVELILLSTRGDVDQRPIDGSSAVGMFTKGIQRAVLNDQADVAIHSLKDLPTAATDGLELVACPPRAPVEDCLISRDGKGLSELAAGAVVGTGSRRRQAQLKILRQDIEVQGIRGNVETRLAKLEQGEYDAIILAAAGLTRLEMSGLITERLPVEDVLPAPGQGALGIEVRSDDQRAREALSALNDPSTFAAVSAERHVLSQLEGGCLAPIGAYGRADGEMLLLDGVVVAIDGSKRLHSSTRGPLEAPEQVASVVAQDLLDQGAKELISEERS